MVLVASTIESVHIRPTMAGRKIPNLARQNRECGRRSCRAVASRQEAALIFHHDCPEARQAEARRENQEVSIAQTSSSSSSTSSTKASDVILSFSAPRPFLLYMVLFLYNPKSWTTDAWMAVPPTSNILYSSRSFAGSQRNAPLVLFEKKIENDEKGKNPVAQEAPSSNSSSTATSEKSSAAQMEKNQEEFEYIEYEDLTEEDFVGSEWQVGTCWESKTNEVKETWVRLATKEDKNIAIWGDNAEGSWSLDVASQFLAISKEYLWGKQIWAGVVDDYYFVQGTVRGWTYLTPASVLGQWQAKRLGVNPEEAGTPPWFEDSICDDDEVGESEEEEP